MNYKTKDRRKFSFIGAHETEVEQEEDCDYDDDDLVWFVYSSIQSHM